MKAGKVFRITGAVLLAFVALFHLQFALQAFSVAPLQALLVLFATGTFVASTVRLFQRRRIASFVMLGTSPLFVFSVVATVIYPDESPIFAVLFGVAPVASAVIAWIRRDSEPLAAV